MVNQVSILVLYITITRVRSLDKSVVPAKAESFSISDNKVFSCCKSRDKKAEEV
jgi:hypothetical protein